jgi:hypothetical protein
MSTLTGADRHLIARARELASADNEYDITGAIGPADDVSYSALIARAFRQAQHLLAELAAIAERLSGGEDQAAADTLRLDRIRVVLARFDWGHDDRQLALEAIERIAYGGQA